MALTTAQIQSAYVTFFNRPADVEGLNYWSSYGGSVANLYATFAQSKEYSDVFAGLTQSAQVNKVYQNLFGREAEASGLNYWVGELANGSITLANLALAVAAGAQSTDLTTFNNRVTAATTFTQQLDTTAEILAYQGTESNAVAKAWLSTVTTDASLATAVAQIDATVAKMPGASSGSTFTLTTSATDVISGTSGNDIIIGDFATSVSTGTIQASDNIDGGAGVDTLKIYSYTGAATEILPVSVKNVEVFEFVAPTATTLDVVKYAASGVTTLSAVQADAVTTLQTGSGQGLKLNTTGTAAAGTTVTWNASATDTALNLELNGVSNASATADTLTITAAAAKTLNITSSGAKNKVILGTTAVDTVNVTGAAALDLGALNAAVTTLGAAAATGGVTAALAGTKATVTTGSGKDVIDVAAVVGVVKVSTGAGNDTVKVGAATIDGSSSFDGGDGRDTIQITDGAKLTAAAGKLFTNFEVLATGTGQNNYDLANIAGIDTVLVDGALAGTTAINNVTTQSVVIAANQSGSVLTVNLKDSSGTNDALTVTLDNQNTSATTFNKAGVSVAAGSLVTTGVENLTLKSAGVITGANATTPGTANSVTLNAGDLALKTLTITGDQAINVTTGAIAANLTKIDASAATGKVGIDASLAAGALSILGGSGADTISSGAAGATINAGKGNDTIILTASTGVKDVVIVGAGDAKVAVTAAGILDTAAGKLETITGFTTNQDVLDLGSFGFSTTQKSAWAVKSDLSAVKFNADIANFFVDTGVARGVAYDATNGYLVIDANKDGNFNADGDLIIKITGVNFADIGF